MQHSGLKTTLSIHDLHLPIGALHKAGILQVMTKPFLIFANLFEESPVSTPNRLGLKKTVHTLQWDTLRLWNEEEHKDDGQDHERREKEVHPVVHLGKHLWSEPGDEEVPEPVGPCRAGLRKRSNVGIEHFLKDEAIRREFTNMAVTEAGEQAYRVNNPWGTVPGRGIKHCPQIEEEHSSNATAIHLLVLSF